MRMRPIFWPFTSASRPERVLVLVRVREIATSGSSKAKVRMQNLQPNALAVLLASQLAMRPAPRLSRIPRQAHTRIDPQPPHWRAKYKLSNYPTPDSWPKMPEHIGYTHEFAAWFPKIGLHHALIVALFLGDHITFYRLFPARQALEAARMYLDTWITERMLPGLPGISSPRCSKTSQDFPRHTLWTKANP